MGAKEAMPWFKVARICITVALFCLAVGVGFTGIGIPAALGVGIVAALLWLAGKKLDAMFLK